VHLNQLILKYLTFEINLIHLCNYFAQYVHTAYLLNWKEKDIFWAITQS